MNINAHSKISAGVINNLIYTDNGKLFQFILEIYKIILVPIYIISYVCFVFIEIDPKICYALITICIILPLLYYLGTLVTKTQKEIM